MKEISVGRFLRIMLILIIIGIAYLVLKSLGGVLVPFFAAWLLAYLIYPIVTFFQYKLRFRYRLLSIITVLLLLLGTIIGITMLVIPSLLSELVQLKSVAVDFITNNA